MKTFIYKTWRKLVETFRIDKYLVQGITIFISSFLFSIASTMGPDFEWTKAAIYGAATSALIYAATILKKWLVEVLTELAEYLKKK